MKYLWKKPCSNCCKMFSNAQLARLHRFYMTKMQVYFITL